MKLIVFSCLLVAALCADDLDVFSAMESYEDKDPAADAPKLFDSEALGIDAPEKRDPGTSLIPEEKNYEPMIQPIPVPAAVVERKNTYFDPSSMNGYDTPVIIKPTPEV
jgi:hypothetical protein